MIDYLILRCFPLFEDIMYYLKSYYRASFQSYDFAKFTISTKKYKYDCNVVGIQSSKVIKKNYFNESEFKFLFL